MRSFRITIGLAIAACTVAAFAAPALAVKEKVFFGHFTAGIAGQEISPTKTALAKGKGEVGELRVGPLAMECETNSGFTLEIGRAHV